MFDSYIAFHARCRPTAPAVVALDGSVSFETFDQHIDRAAFELGGLSVEAGEPVAVAVANPYLHWVLVLALARRGIASAPASDAAAPHRIGDGTDPRGGAVTLTIDADAIHRIRAGPSRTADRIRPEGSALARILHSSGTTGERKRLGMSWDVIDAAIRNALIAYGAPEGPWLASTGIETILGLVVTLAGWAAGNPAVLGQEGTLRPDRVAAVRPRLIALVPDQLQRLLDALPEDHDRWPLRIISGGGPVPPALARRTRLRLTADLRSVYGASETGAVAIADLALLEREAGAAGYVLPRVDVELVDEAGAPQPPGTLGRVRIRSDRIADHPLGDAPALRDGWFVSADLGRLGADGLLRIEGRIDEQMNVGGHKVLPGWIEQAALGYAGVAEAAAFALADADGLERCWLAIVPAPDFAEAALAEALRGQLQWLGQIRLLRLPAMPRNQMGKVPRDRLRALASETCRSA